MPSVPAAIPVTTPEEEPIVAKAGSLLTHTPPAGVEFNVVVKPIQTLPAPVIVVGKAFTVTAAKLEQPAGVV